MAIKLARQIDRVPSMTVPLDAAGERRFKGLMESLVMVDIHEHPMVIPESTADFGEYFRSREWDWGYEAVRAGGWTAVATANILGGLGSVSEPSFVDYAQLVDEVGLMIEHLGKQKDVRKISRADDIVAAKRDDVIGFIPTLEHLAIGYDVNRVNVFHAMGIRIAGLTYTRRSSIGDGQTERTDSGLSDFGVEVVKRMNDVGMVIDLSHTGVRTAHDAIEMSKAPVVFSHNAAHALRPTRRTRADADFLACTRKGGLVAITAVPNALSDDPKQNINCVLDHYDYLVKLLGADHVACGTDTFVGDHVGVHKALLGRDALVQSFPADYLDGLESPADGKNIVRGLIARGHDDATITKIVGGNALRLLRAVSG